MADVNWILLLFKIFKILLIMNWFLAIFFIFGLLITYYSGSYQKYLKDPEKLKKLQAGYTKLQNSKIEALIVNGILIICSLILWILTFSEVLETGDVPPQFFLLLALALIPILIIIFALEAYFKNILEKTKIG